MSCTVNHLLIERGERLREEGRKAMFTVKSQGHKFHISIENESFTAYTIEDVKKGLEHYWATPPHRYTIAGCPLCNGTPYVSPPKL